MSKYVLSFILIIYIPKYDLAWFILYGYNVKVMVELKVLNQNGHKLLMCLKKNIHQNISFMNGNFDECSLFYTLLIYAYFLCYTYNFYHTFTL